MSDARVERYRKDADLERVLEEMNAALDAHAWESFAAASAPVQPVTFVVGLQRSGTTLMMQLLANCFDFTYADNIVARFWRAPHVGVALSRSVHGGRRPPCTFRSDYGTTAESHEPHEFGYFWSHWFDMGPDHELTAAELAKVDVKGLVRSLARMEAAGGAPLLFKAVYIGLNTEFVAGILPSSRFIYLRRDPLAVARSTYRGRLDRYGRADAWWSLRPAGSQQAHGLAPAESVAWQVATSRRRIERALQVPGPRRVLAIDYEELVRDPAGCMQAAGRFLGAVPREIDWSAVASGARAARPLEPAVEVALRAGIGRWERARP
ncbi:MAG: sulfotransferase [Gammaproteobacteria bacterium]